MRATKEFLRGVASGLVVRTGLCAMARRLSPKAGAVIFYGHRLTGDGEGYLEGLRPEWLDEQLAYLTRHYEVISLSRLLRCYEERRPVPARSVVLTFDDGFRDNLLHGLPVLKRYGVSATVFVVTGCAASGEMPWPQRLGCLFLQTRQPAVAIQLGGAGEPPLELSLGSAGERRRAYARVKDMLTQQPRAVRESWLARLSGQLGVEPHRDRMLSWQDLRALQAEGWEFGAHTFSHPWLGRIPLSEAREEMERSREDLREQLGIERPAFCFPAGSHTTDLMALARSLGFRSAFQPSPAHRVNTIENSHPFALARMGLPNAPALYLEAELDGPLHTIRRVLWRRRKSPESPSTGTET